MHWLCELAVTSKLLRQLSAEEEVSNFTSKCLSHALQNRTGMVSLRYTYLLSLLFHLATISQFLWSGPAPQIYPKMPCNYSKRSRSGQSFKGASVRLDSLVQRDVMNQNVAQTVSRVQAVIRVLVSTHIMMQCAEMQAYAM